MQIVQRLIKYCCLLAIGAGIGVSGMSAYQYEHLLHQQRQFAEQDSRSSKIIGGLTKRQRTALAALNYQSDQSVIMYVNHGRSTLNPRSWTNNRVDYQPLDQLGRTSHGNTAFLEYHNHADTSLRSDQNTQPAGWHDNYGGNLVYNRGHLIAYSLTAGINSNTGKYQPTVIGDQNNPQNLFTETDFINQEVQTIYEAKVRHAIEHGQRVIYQVTPIFRHRELVPRGINLQALSTNGQLNFNVYIFNVEPGVKINYQDGSYVMDTGMKIPVPLNAVRAADNQHQTKSQFEFIGNYQRPIATHPRQYIRKW
ncbi:DNA/RNA non-specific endonuclease [uncultured Limosilactobacillus sp.]|uniref:DNA/RNA non-specific endonuclease n=1 Tax=uncultured Limosilactobacillus sp. TaxID=2837629 RepID=UPI0025E123FC|nr:DNA/RNA non-specific endonuclease [uncultured Limosilactobacillus sp.]